MEDLLRALSERRRTDSYVSRLLDAFGGESAPRRGPAAPSEEDCGAGPEQSTDEALSSGLSNRELTVLRLLQEGLSNKEVAERLCVSPDTVRKHTLGIYRKLGVNKRTKAVLAARKLGVLTSK